MVHSAIKALSAGKVERVDGMYVMVTAESMIDGDYFFGARTDEQRASEARLRRAQGDAVFFAWVDPDDPRWHMAQITLN
jgi:hypothetical protein